jgi:hypothetical protein
MDTVDTAVICPRHSQMTQMSLYTSQSEQVQRPQLDLGVDVLDRDGEELSPQRCPIVLLGKNIYLSHRVQ